MRLNRLLEKITTTSNPPYVHTSIPTLTEQLECQKSSAIPNGVVRGMLKILIMALVSVNWYRDLLTYDFLSMCTLGWMIQKSIILRGKYCNNPLFHILDSLHINFIMVIMFLESWLIRGRLIYWLVIRLCLGTISFLWC